METRTTSEPARSMSEEPPSSQSDALLSSGHPRRKKRLLPCLESSCNRKFTSEHTRKVRLYIFVPVYPLSWLTALTVRLIQKHMVAHSAKPKEKFLCRSGCSAQFSRHHDRLRHEVAQHNSSCPWTCVHCSHPFSSQRSLDSHVCSGTHLNVRS